MRPLSALLVFQPFGAASLANDAKGALPEFGKACQAAGLMVTRD